MNNRVGNIVVNAFLAGDVNGDKSVDAGDIAAIRASYGSHAGQARYNPAADFTHSGRVGIVDLQVARLNFGAHVTLPHLKASLIVENILATAPSSTAKLATISQPNTAQIKST